MIEGVLHSHEREGTLEHAQLYLLEHYRNSYTRICPNSLLDALGFGSLKHPSLSELGKKMFPIQPLPGDATLHYLHEEEPSDV